MTGSTSAENGRWKQSYATAAGLRLRVGRHGTGAPLLLITGIGAHLDMWAPMPVISSSGGPVPWPWRPTRSRRPSTAT